MAEVARLGRWSDILDASVAGKDDASHLAVLGLPMLDGWQRGHAWATWQVRSDLLTPAVASLFGGYIAGLADHLLGLAVMTVLREHESFATSELHVHFFRPVREGTLEIEARVVNRGKQNAYCEAAIRDSSGRLMARAGASQSIREA